MPAHPVSVVDDKPARVGDYETKLKERKHHNPSRTCHAKIIIIVVLRA